MAERRLRVEADLDLTIDGRSATLRGSGRRLVLTLERASMLRDLLRVELPAFSPQRGGGPRGASGLTTMLADAGFTVEVHDERGPLLIIGADAPEEGIGLPFLGRVRRVKVAGAAAALRLALNG